MKIKKGIALVMANAEYIQQHKLPACKKDWKDIKEVFEYLNFDVISGLDLKRSDMYDLILRFIDEAKSYSTVLVYYSGHGVQIDGENYFVPIDCEYKTSKSIFKETQLVGINSITEFMTANPNKTNIMILDACRSNVNFSKDIVGTGLTEAKAGNGTLIAFATSPNEVARADITEDGNSYYKELELVQEGKGTREWTPEQQKDILEKGRAYDENGKAFEGQHMKSAEMYPEYQGEPGNIQFLTREEHLAAHDGNWQNSTNWYYNPVTKEKFDFGDGPFIPCEIIQLQEPIILLTDDSTTIQESITEEKEEFSKGENVLKQSAETNKKTYSKPETSKSSKVQVEVPKKANNMFVSGLKSVGKFVVQHPIESLEIAGVVIVGAAKVVSSIKGRGGSRTHDTASATSSTNSSSVAEKVVDIVEKASRSLPSENDVSGHKQRYHTKSGVVWKDKAPYHRGGK